ncbi:MAG: right-handed parallel beta-helix repeat-containing protein [Acidobacteriota bacterium]
MTENFVKVRAKPMAPERRSHTGAWLAAIACVAAAIAAIGFDAVTGRLGFFAAPIETAVSSSGRVIKVSPGGSIQVAVDRAESGDTIELQAGATYFGEIKLPNKRLTDFVTIRSSAADSLPANQRVGPANAASMAKIVARGEGKSAVTAEKGANHYRFAGIEFTSDGSGYVYNLLLFGNGEAAADLPHDLEIDRCYLHTGKTGIIRRGIAVNSAKTVIKNSYFEGFGFAGEETQAIAGWTGTRNIQIVNNYVEGGAENILFGGADPDSADLIPIDIEIRGNHLNKPAAWAHGVTVKTLFELKNAKRVEFIGNLLTNNFQGPALRITIRDQGGKAPFSTIEDVTIRDNVIDHAADGINILGKDDTYSSQVLKRLTIQNNLFLHLATGGNFDGAGYFIQVSDGENIIVSNNTVFNSGNIVSFYGTLPRSFVFRDNIVNHGNYGVHGLEDLKSSAARSMFAGNVVMNLNNVGSGDMALPPGSIVVSGTKAVGFVDTAAHDYRLAPSSRFKGKGTNGSDPGCDPKKTGDFPAIPADAGE